MEHLAFNAYAYHQQEIEDFINYLANAGDPNDFYAQRAAAQAANLDMNSLTSSEIDYIEREVAKRR
jgi:hypothetical protein